MLFAFTLFVILQFILLCLSLPYKPHFMGAHSGVFHHEIILEVEKACKQCTPTVSP